MTSAALGAKSVAIPARNSCVRTTSTRTMSTMRRTSPMKIRRSALIGTTIASFNRGTVLVLELDDEPDRARASGHAGTDLGPACASGAVGRARVQVRVVDQHDHAAARAAAAARLRPRPARPRPRRAPGESAARAARAAVATLPGVGRSTRGPDGPDTTCSTGPAEPHRPRGAGTAAEFAAGGRTRHLEGPVDRRGARDEDPRVPRGERDTGRYRQRRAVDVTRQRHRCDRSAAEA